MKVHISNTSLCFYLAFYLYAEMDFGVHMITQWLGLGAWIMMLSQRNKADLVKYSTDGFVVP